MASEWVSQLDTRLEETPSWARLMEEALTMPGHLSSVYSMFYRYSFNNQILLWMQGVQEPVATLRRWGEMNRRVKKGSKAKAILRPITVKLRNDLDEEGNPKQITKFKLVRALFTVSETEGDDLPPYVPPTWNEEQALTNLGITRVPFTLLDGNCQGFSYDKNIAINPVAGFPFKTLAHELGHVCLGHTVPGKEADYVSHRGIAEFQAEAVAYLVLNELGATDQFDASASRGYIAQWLQGTTPPDAAIKEVFKAVDLILKAGTVSSEEAAAA